MADPGVCGNCGATLPDRGSADSPTRGHCPECGFTNVTGEITVSLEGVAAVGATGTVSVEALPPVDLLLQTVVIPGESTAEGQLIEAVAQPWFEIIELLKADPTIAYQIGHRKWEEIIAGAYVRARFDEVTLTPPSGDYGRDVIAIKRGLGSVRVIDQVKAYKPGHLVTADDVRALVGVLDPDGASKGFLTTTSDFAPKLREDPLIKPLMPSKLELINGTDLLRRLRELAEKSRGGR